MGALLDDWFFEELQQDLRNRVAPKFWSYFKGTHYKSPVARKPVFRVFGQVKHKPDSTATEDGQRLEILDLESRGLYYLCSKNKGPD